MSLDFVLVIAFTEQQWIQSAECWISWVLIKYHSLCYSSGCAPSIGLELCKLL